MQFRIINVVILPHNYNQFKLSKMKKLVSLFAVAAFLFAACGNTAPAEPVVEETTEIEATIEEPVVDEATADVEATEEAAPEVAA